MPLLDARGRVFGRWNLIDASIAMFLLLLIPAGFVIYRVFRVPDPVIAAVTPPLQPPGAERRIRVTGRNFRPFLRAYVNKTGAPFSLVNRTVELSEGNVLVETPEVIEIVLPPLTAATYDLYIFDELRQVAERPAAFTLGTPADITVEATVRFTVVSELVPLVKSGDEDTTAPGDPASGDFGHATLKDIRLISGNPVTLDLQFPTAVGSSMSGRGDGAGGTTIVHAAGRALEATVALPVERTANGAWLYKGRAVRAGDGLSFQTSRYAMYGVILRVAELSAAPASNEKGAPK